MIDMESITTAFSAVKAAKDLGTTLVELRDFNQVASTVTELNRKLLQAQESLFAHQAKMFELQAREVQVLKELGELKEAAKQRARYALVELSPGVFAYRLKLPQQGQDGAVMEAAEPIHHVCQRCLDGGTKVVLQRHAHFGSIYLRCSGCASDYFTGVREPWEIPTLSR